MTKQEKIREGLAMRLYFNAIEVMLDGGYELEPVDWDELPEVQRGFFRNNADIFRGWLHSQGVVIKVNTDLQVLFTDEDKNIISQTKSEMAVVEPLIGDE